MTSRIFRHWKTSMAGMIPAVLIWWQGVGFKIPETKAEWGAAVGGILIAVMGLGSRDSRDKPPKEKTSA